MAQSLTAESLKETPAPPDAHLLERYKPPAAPTPRPAHLAFLLVAAPVVTRLGVSAEGALSQVGALILLVGRAAPAAHGRAPGSRRRQQRSAAHGRRE